MSIRNMFVTSKPAAVNEDAPAVECTRCRCPKCEPPPAQAVRPHRCGSCGSVFASASNLGRHEATCEPPSRRRRAWGMKYQGE